MNVAQGKAASAATLGTRRKIDQWSSVRSDRILSAASRVRALFDGREPRSKDPGQFEETLKNSA